MYFLDLTPSAPSLEPSLGCFTLQLTLAVNKNWEYQDTGMPSRWLTGSSGGSAAEGTSSELCGPTVLPTSVTNVRVLAQGTNTGPCFKVEELSC